MGRRAGGTLTVVRWIIVVVFVGGCVSTDTTRCEKGERCPMNTECVTITYASGEIEPTCVRADQRTACGTLLDGMHCMFGTTAGTCHEQVCFANECGNRLVGGVEACDDGNQLAGDGCSATCESNESCGNGVIDLVLGESCDDADALSNDGCSSGCAAESPTWVSLENARPRARAGMALVYDLARGRTVMFGGGTNSTLYGDTAEWDGRRWSRPSVAAEPLPRQGHAMAYDVERRQLVMFGGDAAGEMWLRERDGTWSVKTPATRPPFVRVASMVYDARHKRVVLFGGIGNMEPYDRTWTWNGTTWAEITTQPRPPGRSAAAMAYDPKRGVVVLFGGSRYAPTDLDDVWELDGDTWVERQPTTPKPAARHGAAMAYDPISERILLVGGQVGLNTNKETWAWDGTTWLRLADANVVAPDTGVFRHAMATDATRGRALLIGTRGDLQEWTGTAWNVVDQLAPPPEPQVQARSQHAAALDPLRREVVVFGGVTSSTQGDTWIWNGSWRPAMGSPSLTPRYGATLVFDEARRELVLFGGCTATTALAQTWVWKAGAWTQKSPPASPPARCHHASAYHRGRGAVVVFGGYNPASGSFGDTWTWNGTTWTSEPGTTPGVRFAPSMASDPVRDQLVMFGGRANLSSGETWTWNGQGWIQALPPSSPAARYQAAMAWDAARQRVVLFAGNGDITTSADVWEWDGATWELIPTARPPLARSQHALVPDLDGAGVLVIGGATTPPGPVPLGDVWRLTWSFRGAEERCTSVDGDGDQRVGTEDPDCWSTLRPLCPPATSCDPSAPHCGDGTCNLEIESCAVCPTDCFACPPTCGDFACGAAESMTSCPGDCGA